MASRSTKRSKQVKRSKPAKRSTKKSVKRSSDKRKLSGYERFVHKQMKKMENDPHYKNLTMQEKMNLIEKVWIAVR